MPPAIRAEEADIPLVLVDENGEPIGIAPKLVAHVRGLKHLAISVIVFNSKGQLLLQRRAEAKYHSGGLWTNACCSHPYPGEAVAAAAARRLDEEMGFKCHLQPMFSTAYRAEFDNGLIENEYVHVFGGMFDGSPEPNPSEVDAWRWQSLDDIIAETKSRPDDFTAWFAIYLERFGSCFRDVAAVARSAA